MIRFRTFGLLFTLLLSYAASAQNMVHDLDSLLKAYNREDEFNGTVIAAKNGEVVFKKGYGFKNTAKKQLNDSSTIYQLGSVTKTFTSTMILMLQEQGKLNVKDYLQKYMPDYPDADKITIEQLLTHTSGIFNYTDDSVFRNKDMFKHQSRKDLIGVFKDKITKMEPGEKFSYSNSNYLLLGYIIEDITGKSYYAALREMILTPLGMHHTGCDFKGLKSADKATGYFSIAGGTGVASPFVDSSVSFAAGAIYSTVSDMYIYAQALLDNKLLRPVDWMMATKPNKENYGYGWMLGEMYGHKSVGHNGGVHGFVSNFFMVPEDKTVVVLLCNDMTNDPGNVRRAVTSLLYYKGFEMPAGKKQVNLPLKTMQEYVGDYELAPGFVIKITLQGKALMGQVTGQSPFRMYAERKDHFFLKVVDAQISFARKLDGKIEKLMLRQNGKIIPGMRK
jgi:CubicO group peptidase (beta-lactamase class C family)